MGEHRPAFEGAIGGTVCSLIILSAWWLAAPKVPAHATYQVTIPSDVHVSVSGDLHASKWRPEREARADDRRTLAGEHLLFSSVTANGVPMVEFSSEAIPPFPDGTSFESRYGAGPVWYAETGIGQFIFWTNHAEDRSVLYNVAGFNRQENAIFERTSVGKADAWTGSAYVVNGDWEAVATP